MMDGTMDTIKVFLGGVEIFFIVYLIGYSTFLFLSVAVGSSTLYRKKQQVRMKSILMQDYYVPVTIVVPAYNEEITVVETVKSLLALDYKLYEIIVVDDGSKDCTSQVLIDAFHMQQIRRPVRYQIECQPAEFVYETTTQKVPLTVIRKKNGGKADALNMGINASNYPYFICMDADSVLQYDSLSKIVQPVLEQGDVVAVGGTVRPSNNVELENGRVKKYRLPKNILACMQVLEYDRSFLASRILFDKFNGSLIISGAFGLFKKDVVIAAGGYDHTTMGEDMELVVKLHEYCVVNEMPYVIRYATDAICWTQAPERLRDLCKQRKRWHLGLFQSMWRHRVMLFNPKFGAVSFVSYLYFLLYELLSPFIEVFGIFTMVLAYCVDLINVPFMILFFVIYAIFGSVMSLTAFFARIHTIDLKISFSDVIKAVCLCFFEITCLRFVMAFVRTTAFIGYKKKKLNWGRIERKKIDLRILLVSLPVLLSLFCGSHVSAQVTTTKEAAGDAGCIYVAGNPDMYPVEYYNEKTECYEGIFPEMLEKVSEKTGIDFVYISGGSRNRQSRLAKNCQVEMVSVHEADEISPENLSSEMQVLTIERGEKAINVYIGFTQIASQGLVDQISSAMEQVCNEELTGITLSYMAENEQPGFPSRYLLLAFGVPFLLCIALSVYVLHLRRQKKTQKEIEMKDPLTGIGNADYLEHYYEQFISPQAMELYYMAYVRVNIVPVRQYQGDTEAEELQRYCASLLSQYAGDEELAARLDEGVFVLLFQSGNDENAEQRIEQFLAILRSYSQRYHKEYQPDFHVGVYHLEADCRCEMAVFGARQGYLYAVKHHKDFVLTNQKLLENAKNEPLLQLEVQEAVKKQQIQMYLQFVVDKNTKEICGAEALSRWQNPREGLLNPGKYLEIMHDAGVIVQLDFYILEEACKQLVEWRQRGLGQLHLACNFTRTSICGMDFLPRFKAIVEKYEFDRKNLWLEITEEFLTENSEAIRQNLWECRKIGCYILLDDFGSGYSSLRDLCELPVNCIKIDRGILKNVIHPKGMSLLKAMNTMAHEMNMEVLCEGVETEEENLKIEEIPCEYIQGFYYSRVLPKDHAMEYYEEYSDSLK